MSQIGPVKMIFGLFYEDDNFSQIESHVKMKFEPMKTINSVKESTSLMKEQISPGDAPPSTGGVLCNVSIGK